MIIAAHFEEDNPMTLSPANVVQAFRILRTVVARLAVAEVKDPGGTYPLHDSREYILGFIRRLEPCFAAYCDAILKKETLKKETLQNLKKEKATG